MIKTNFLTRNGHYKRRRNGWTSGKVPSAKVIKGCEIAIDCMD